jgi:hypothetical protein
VIVDAWDPKTFGAELTVALTDHSKLVFDYYVEDRKLMDEYINSSPHQSLKPNRHASAYRTLHEHSLAPILSRNRIRAWHYTRHTDEEADAMHQKLVASSLNFLRERLNNLVAKHVLTQKNAETIFAQSPFHQQHDNRSGFLCTTIIPLSHLYGGVEPLLENWGGESAYFWLSDERLVETLKRAGIPRIVEIETALSDKLNGYKVAETVLNAWARQFGAPAPMPGCDLFILKCIDTAKVIRIHTKGDGFFDSVGTTYPNGVDALLEERK